HGPPRAFGTCALLSQHRPPRDQNTPAVSIPGTAFDRPPPFTSSTPTHGHHVVDHIPPDRGAVRTTPPPRVGRATGHSWPCGRAAQAPPGSPEALSVRRMGLVSAEPARVTQVCVPDRIRPLGATFVVEGRAA